MWLQDLYVFNFILRYGEKNNAFIVASFENEDENKDEISRKVTRALDKVTSDYHSGSSSSDEETSKEMEVKPNSVTAAASPVYQVTMEQLSFKGMCRDCQDLWKVVLLGIAQGFWFEILDNGSCLPWC